MFTVRPLNRATKEFASARDAVSYGATMCHLHPQEQEKMVAALNRGDPVEWTYGFSGCEIVPEPRYRAK